MRIIILFVLTGLSHLCNAEDYKINHYDIRLKISINGAIEVTESIDVEFSEERRGIDWTIPYKYNYNGSERILQIYNVSVQNKKSEIIYESDSRLVTLVTI